jgi:hypothetical protein
LFTGRSVDVVRFVKNQSVYFLSRVEHFDETRIGSDDAERVVGEFCVKFLFCDTVGRDLFPPGGLRLSPREEERVLFQIGGLELVDEGESGEDKYGSL